MADGVKQLPPPEGVDPETYWEHVGELKSHGVGPYMATRIARKELLRKLYPERPWDRVHAPLDSNDSPQDRETRIKQLEAFSKRYGSKGS